MRNTAAVVISGWLVAAAASCGVANAATTPDVIGQKYSDARSALSGAGLSPQVGTTVGDRLPWPKCLVMFQRDRTDPPPPNTGSRGTPVHRVILSLNCEAPAASAKTPGNSLASPQGRAARSGADH